MLEQAETAAPLWSSAERAAWRWPDALTVPQWAERHRRLEGAEYAEPGAWRNDRNPLMASIASALTDPDVDEVGCRKAAQVGWSETIRNFVGWIVDHEPGPILYVLPDRVSAEEQFADRLGPLCRDTPAVARHLSSRKWDTTKGKILFDSCTAYAAWAGSSQSTKSRPIRYALLDEIEEFPRHSGGGGDPVSKVRVRLTTFAAKRRSKLLAGSTPTSRHGHLARFEKASDIMCPRVPCPGCGAYHRLAWKEFRYPPAEEGEDRDAHAARVEADELCRWACPDCGFEADDREHKTRMLAAHRYVGPEQTVAPGGRVSGPAPRRRRRTFIFPGQFSPWVSWSKLAAEWIAAQGDPPALMDFVNQRLAEYWEQEADAPRESELDAKASAAKAARGVVPAWAGKVIVGIDTQQAGFWYAAYGFGHRYRCRLVECGYCTTFDELWRLCVDRQWPVEGSQAAASPDLVMIDSQGGTQGSHFESRTDEVYEFADRAPGLVYPVAGKSGKTAARIAQTVRLKPLRKRRTAGGNPVVLADVHVDRVKDQLARHLRVPDDQPERFELHAGVDPTYLAQMSSEHKVVDPRTGTTFWEQRGGRENHLWDCTVYAWAGALSDLGNVAAIPSDEEVAEQRRLMAEVASYTPQGNFVQGHRNRY